MASPISLVRRPGFSRALWLGVFAAALVARAGWGAFRLVQAQDRCALEFPDEEQYWLMADSLRRGEGLRDELGFRATRMPFYPALLAPFAGMGCGVVIAKILHWFLGAGVAALAAMTARAMFDRRVGWVAGLLVAVDPFLIFFSSLLLTETLFTGVLVGLWWVAWTIVGDRSTFEPSGAGQRRAYGGMRQWVLLAAVASLAVYVREAAAGLVILLLCFLAACRRFDRRIVGRAMIVGCCVHASLIPWAIRNAHVTGKPRWLTYRAGISLYDGIGPQATGASDLGSIKQMPAVRGLSEVEWNRYFLDRSIEAIKADPMRIVRLAGVKLRRMWNPFPNVRTYQSGPARVVSAAWTLPVFALSVTGIALLLARRRREGWPVVGLLVLPALYLSALHCIFVGSVRYRLAAMPMLEILAAYALVQIAVRVWPGRWHPEPANGH